MKANGKSANDPNEKDCGLLIPKKYSLREAFGPEFPADKEILGFRPSACRFIPKRNPLWVWDRNVLRDLIYFWEFGSSDGLHVFGHHGTGKSSAVRQFCAALYAPLYAKCMHEEVQFEDLVTHVDLADGSTIPSYGWLPLAMGADGYPGIFLANEIDRGRPGTLVGLHEILDGEPLVVQLGGLDPIAPSSFFRIATTGNSAMAGDRTGLYGSIKRQDVSFADRFMMTKVEYLPPDAECQLLERAVPALPVALREAKVKVANEIRRRFMGESTDSSALPVTMSTRMLLRWARMTLAFRSGQSHGVNPVFYALERTLLNATDATDGVRRAVEEIAHGVLGHSPVAS
jgi:cobaltochelatase CobS